MTACSFFSATFYYVPRALHNIHIVDLDQKLAGTSRNPYDILGLERDAPKKATWEAYHAETKRLSLLRSCDKSCREQKDDLKQIRGFLTGEFWRESTDKDEWDDWISMKMAEWKVLGGCISEAFTGKPMEKPVPMPARSPAPSRARKRGMAGGASSD
eukprot:CAMPEP_0172806382 /NCGR_PEP_ID=MMETSP1075-20121228/6327_1 /TAXON_ID=2916 /ORGANISM="Ceratium fusus, Strain PA161109" /LENGTH=156 /DNA_ID=CAMNT_0013645173 /DNA_START=565 /DNA_END=1033 /DNA_ORIENTATION=+